LIPRAEPRIQWVRLLRRYGTLIGFLAILVFFSLRLPTTFPTVNNVLNITQQVSMLAVIAFTMTIVMAMNDFDLSVGTMASLAGIVAALLFQQGQSVEVGILAAVGVGILGGLLNGTVVSYIGISPFVATLGGMTMFSGLAFLLSDGKTIFGRAIPKAVSDFALNGIPLGTIDGRDVAIPNLTIVALIVLAVVWVILEQTVYGRRLYAIGGNKEAARLAGVRVRLLRLTAFIATGFGAALGGLMIVSRVQSANPTQGDPFMLNAIAAVFLGMTLSEEGEPHVLGTLIGVLMLGVLTNGLTQLRINSYIQQILTGAIIVLAVTLSSLTKRNN